MRGAGEQVSGENRWDVQMPAASSALQGALRAGYPGEWSYREDAGGVLHYDEAGECARGIAELMGRRRCGECDLNSSIPLRKPLGDAWHAAELAAELTLWDALLRGGAAPERLQAVTSERRERAQRALSEWEWPTEVSDHLTDLLEGRGAECQERTLMAWRGSGSTGAERGEDMGDILVQALGKWRGEDMGTVSVPTLAVQVPRRSTLGHTKVFEEAGEDIGDPLWVHHTLTVLWRDGMRARDAHIVAQLLQNNT